jgi:hypothetical protein
MQASAVCGNARKAVNLSWPTSADVASSVTMQTPHQLDPLVRTGQLDSEPAQEVRKRNRGHSEDLQAGAVRERGRRFRIQEHRVHRGRDAVHVLRQISTARSSASKRGRTCQSRQSLAWMAGYNDEGPVARASCEII